MMAATRTCIALALVTALASGCALRHIRVDDETEPAWTEVERSKQARGGAAPASAAASPPARMQNCYLAVLEFTRDGQVAPQVIRLLSDSVREAALGAGRDHGCNVMTRESMDVILADMGRCEIEEGSCEVETGRQLGADYLVTGEIVLVEGEHFLTLKLFGVEGGVLLATRRVRGKTPAVLIDALEQDAPLLFTDWLERDSPR